MTAEAQMQTERSNLLNQDAPDISCGRAAEIARDVFGVTGAIRCLSAEKDANFCIRSATDEPLLLKITNAAEDRSVTDMQTRALRHLAQVDPSLPVPRVCPTLSGETSGSIVGPDGQTHVVRLLTYLEGTVLSEARTGAGLHSQIGALLARLTLGLRGFHHLSAVHTLQWDIKQAHLLRPMLAAVEDVDLRKLLTYVLDRFDAEIAPQLPHMHAQIVHNDFNPHNLLVDGPQATRLTGVIDFGDMVHTPVVCDLAIACAYQIAEGPDPFVQIAAMIDGFDEVLPLKETEIDLLPDLMCLRHAASLVIGAWRSRRYPENADYILRNAEASRRGLAVLLQIGPEATRMRLRETVRTTQRRDTR